MSANIYQYTSASRYLLDRVVEKQKADPQFSIRKWAKEMGFPSHSLLAMVLQGKRGLTLKQVPFFVKGLNLNTPERMYFQGLIQLENAQTPEDRTWCELWVSELRPKSLDRTVIREIDEYAAIANWIHPALLALSDTRSSFQDANEASIQLGLKGEINEVRAALERLIALDLIKLDSEKKFRATCTRMTSKDDIANRGVREYHKQCAALVPSKIESQDPLEREFQSMAVAIPSSRLALAKDLIRKFRTQFEEAMSSPDCDQVYQLNLHFFRLTESPSKLNALKENEGADVSTNQQPQSLGIIQ